MITSRHCLASSRSHIACYFRNTAVESSDWSLVVPPLAAGSAGVAVGQRAVPRTACESSNLALPANSGGPTLPVFQRRLQAATRAPCENGRKLQEVRDPLARNGRPLIVFLGARGVGNVPGVSCRSRRAARRFCASTTDCRGGRGTCRRARTARGDRGVGAATWRLQEANSKDTPPCLPAARWRDAPAFCWGPTRTARAIWIGTLARCGWTQTRRAYRYAGARPLGRMAV